MIDRIRELPELTIGESTDYSVIVDDNVTVTKQYTLEVLYQFFKADYIVPDFVPFLEDTAFLATQRSMVTSSFSSSARYTYFSPLSINGPGGIVNMNNEPEVYLYYYYNNGGIYSWTLDTGVKSFNDASTSKVLAPGEYIYFVLNTNNDTFYIINTNLP